ncbi:MULTISPECIES: MOP flippase family protein [unclassified Sphingobacterium]|uniref:MOP flippase family protein n=1 Tax=unclassified Sphingobacterium TaxID=2609468 RepID=UPI00104BE4D2|nr:MULTISPECIES: MOP flippase family protein [unclassified Sphingobacterium]MCS3555822.1 O-antigen/teichoic acid export membrane protein [Sphingobacterium sp. JUb21]TCR00725.1 teichuronic acid exporter [Sphingobacterium sp. JUb20]
MGLVEKTTSGIKWSSLSTIIRTTVQIIQLSLLTYLLDKSDFGILAIASMIIGFTEIFSNLGLAVGIIHKQNITNEEYSTLYWLNIIASIFIFLVLCGITPFLAKFYNENILNTIIPLLGVQIVINSFGKIFQTIKTKELDFQFISKISIVSVIIGFLITLLLAFNNFGLYSLVIGQLVQSFINQMVYVFYGRKNKIIKFYFNFKEVRPFVMIGGYQLGTQIMDYVSSKIDVFLIGRFFGMEALGIYNVAKELVLKPFLLINSLVISVVSAAFSKIQNDLDKVKINFAKVLKLVSLITIPIYAIMYVFSDVIVDLLYSSAFAQVGLFIKLMILVGICGSISSVSSVLIIAKGRTDIGFIWTIFRVTISVVVVLITSQFGINVVAWSQSILYVFFLFVFWRIAAFKLSGLSLMEYVNTFLESLIVVLILGLVFLFISTSFVIPIAGQILLIVLFLLFYIGYYFIFNKGLVKDVIRLIVK